MNLYHLRYFVTLAHLEHYTKAAELLSITQPSLSHAISSLESELGVKLFEKEGRNIVLTKCGQAFLEDVEQSLSILDSSVNKLQMTGSGEGQIDIAVLRTLSTQLVPGLVRDYIKEHPKQNIDFRFHNSTGLTPDMIEGLKNRKYDIAFCSKMENEPAIEFIPVSKQELVLIVPNGHPLCTRDEIDLADTLPYPHIGFPGEAVCALSLTSCSRSAKASPSIPTRWRRTRLWQVLCPPASASLWCPTWLSLPTCRCRSSASSIPPGSGCSTCAP